MAVQQIKMDFAGESNIVPRLGRLYAPNNSLAQIEAVGFLNQYIQTQNLVLYPTDFIACVGSDGQKWLRPSLSGGNWQLIALSA